MPTTTRTPHPKIALFLMLLLASLAVRSAPAELPPSTPYTPDGALTVLDQVEFDDRPSPSAPHFVGASYLDPANGDLILLTGNLLVRSRLPAEDPTHRIVVDFDYVDLPPDGWPFTDSIVGVHPVSQQRFILAAAEPMSFLGVSGNVVALAPITDRGPDVVPEIGPFEVLGQPARGFSATYDEASARIIASFASGGLTTIDLPADWPTSPAVVRGHAFTEMPRFEEPSADRMILDPVMGWLIAVYGNSVEIYNYDSVTGDLAREQAEGPLPLAFGGAYWDQSLHRGVVFGTTSSYDLVPRTEGGFDFTEHVGDVPRVVQVTFSAAVQSRFRTIRHEGQDYVVSADPSAAQLWMASGTSFTLAGEALPRSVLGSAAWILPDLDAGHLTLVDSYPAPGRSIMTFEHSLFGEGGPIEPIQEQAFAILGGQSLAGAELDTAAGVVHATTAGSHTLVRTYALEEDGTFGEVIASMETQLGFSDVEETIFDDATNSLYVSMNYTPPRLARVQLGDAESGHALGGSLTLGEGPRYAERLAFGWQNLSIYGIRWDTREAEVFFSRMDLDPGTREPSGEAMLQLPGIIVPRSLLADPLRPLAYAVGHSANAAAEATAQFVVVDPLTNPPTIVAGPVTADGGVGALGRDVFTAFYDPRDTTLYVLTRAVNETNTPTRSMYAWSLADPATPAYLGEQFHGEFEAGAISFDPGDWTNYSATSDRLAQWTGAPGSSPTFVRRLQVEGDRFAAAETDGAVVLRRWASRDLMLHASGRSLRTIALRRGGVIEANRLDLSAPHRLEAIEWRSHVPQGEARVGVYRREGESITLLWQSGPIALTTEDMEHSIEPGAGGLLLGAGEYWLAWTVDGNDLGGGYVGEVDPSQSATYPRGASGSPLPATLPDSSRIESSAGWAISGTRAIVSPTSVLIR